MDDRSSLIQKYQELLAKRGNAYVTRDEYLSQYGLSMSDILRTGLDGFSGLVAAAGGPAPTNVRLEEEKMLLDYCAVARKLGRPPSVELYRAHGKHSPTNMTKRFGGKWSNVKEQATEYLRARGDDPFADLLDKAKDQQPRPAAKTNAKELPNSVLRPPGQQSDLANFTQESRVGVEMMAGHYAKLYCLERQMRTMVSDTLSSAHGDGWWDTHVPQDVREYAKHSLGAEERLGVTPRSSRLVDYITLGDLGKIVSSNWRDFENVFRNQQAMQRIMRDLNMLRAFVAHCTPLPSDEVTRLDLNIKDWHRQIR